MSIVPIVIAINHDYIIPAITTIRSVLESTPHKNRIKFIIFHRDLDQLAMDVMTEMTTRYGGRISFMNMKHAFSNVIEDKVRQIEMYYSLLIPTYLKDHEFVFSIDADMLVSGDLLSLIPQIPSDRKIGAVRCGFRNAIVPPGIDTPLHDETRLVGIDDTRNYFNAGLMLFNMKRITDEDRANCIRYILRDWPGHGESILNLVFHDSVHFFSFRWNFPMPFTSETIMEFHPDIRDDISEGRRNPNVCHFLFISKPWHPEHKEMIRIGMCPALKTRLENYRDAIHAVMKEVALLTPRIICGPAWDDMERLVTPQEQPLH